MSTNLRVLPNSYALIQIHLRRSRVERPGLSSRFRGSIVSRGSLPPPGTHPGCLALPEICRRITRRRTHVGGYSPVRESPWRGAEIPSHAYVGLDAPGCRRFDGITGGIHVRTVHHRPSATEGHEPTRQILFERAPADCRRPRSLGRTGPPAASGVKDLPLLLISSPPLSARALLVPLLSRPRRIARTIFRFLPSPRVAASAS